MLLGCRELCVFIPSTPTFLAIFNSLERTVLDCIVLYFTRRSPNILFYLTTPIRWHERVLFSFVQKIVLLFFYVPFQGTLQHAPLSSTEALAILSIQPHAHTRTPQKLTNAQTPPSVSTTLTGHDHAKWFLQKVATVSVLPRCL